jgi:MFS transporter, ACS family, tartrate transporter
MLSARRKIAIRLLPFLFTLYLVNYIDRVNVSFAALRMSADLGLSDRVYGLGAGIFFLTYVLFEIPGTILVERWSARKWIARIMVTWGLVTMLTAFIHTAHQFYTARLLLGAAEASFFPGVILYLTRWFRIEDRARAIAVFYASIPVGMLIGSSIASRLLGIHWQRSQRLPCGLIAPSAIALLAGWGQHAPRLPHTHGRRCYLHSFPRSVLHR